MAVTMEYPYSYTNSETVELKVRNIHQCGVMDFRLVIKLTAIQLLCNDSRKTVQHITMHLLKQDNSLQHVCNWEQPGSYLWVCQK